MTAFRCLVLGLIMSLLVLLAGCGSHAGINQAPPTVSHTKPGFVGGPPPGSPAVGDVLYTSSGHWSGSPTGFTYAWEDCDSGGGSCTTAAGSPTNTQRYVVVSGDIASTIRVAVTAAYSGHPSSTVSSQPTAVVAGSSSPQVGAPSPSGVSCTTTLNAGANVASAMSSASAGSTVCLNPGSWGDISLSNAMSPASTVTLAATPTDAVTTGCITFDAAISNVTVEGFDAQCIGILSPSSGGINIQYNTIENHSKAIAMEQDAQAHGGSGSITGVHFQYNQIDHEGQCLADVRAISDTDFEHNVCGPDIGFGATASTDPGHYIESGGESGSTFDYNAFIGPACSCAGSSGIHLNVFHLDGTSDDIDFSHNLMWHSQAIAQMVLIQEGAFSNLTITDNLSVEDGANCMPSTSTACANEAFEIYTPHTMTFSNNTVENTALGIYLGPFCSNGCNATATGETVQNNIVEPVPSIAGAEDFSDFECASGCTVGSNVTADGSASSVVGGSGNVNNWTASFQDTTFTPAIPWADPPSDYYKPTVAGGVLSTMGYQGTVGP